MTAISTIRGDSRLIFNCDGDSTTLAHFQPPITPLQLCRTIDELEGTQVDTFIYCLNRGDDTFSHRTKVGEIYGRNVTDWQLGETYRSDPQAPKWQKTLAAMERIAENTEAILATGNDPLAILGRRARELGMSFWAGLRMNDIHEDDGIRFFPLRSTFKRDHPELLIGSPYPNPAEGYPRDDFTWAFDYARSEVRERKLALIEEACANYDLDGFELDFQRGPWYFKSGQIRQGVPLMTDLVRSVRETMQRIAADKRHPMTLAIRVPPTLALCEAKGLDARTWIREELADIFIPMAAGYMDIQADIREFAAAEKGTKCTLAGGLEPYLAGGGRADIRLFRDTANKFRQQGASRIYLFNFDCHRRNGRENPYTVEELAILKEIGHP